MVGYNFYISVARYYFLFTITIFSCNLLIEILLILFFFNIGTRFDHINPFNYLFFVEKCPKNLSHSNYNYIFAPQKQKRMARQLSWLERMIHNHEVPGSIPGLATETEKVERLSPFLFYIIVAHNGSVEIQCGLLKWLTCKLWGAKQKVQ